MAVVLEAVSVDARKTKSVDVAVSAVLCTLDALGLIVETKSDCATNTCSARAGFATDSTAETGALEQVVSVTASLAQVQIVAQRASKWTRVALTAICGSNESRRACVTSSKLDAVDWSTQSSATCNEIKRCIGLGA